MPPDALLPVAFVLGYLCGSIPFGLILTRLAGTQDLRSIGSGSIGATNVLRTGRKSLAAGTLLGDMLGPLIVQGISDRESHGKAQEWTGWALLAAMYAMEMHDHVLPVPGRNARDRNAALAGAAFEAGRRITIAAALNLIDRAERGAASGTRS